MSVQSHPVARRTVRYSTLILVATVFSAPFLWLLDIALKSQAQLGAWPVQWLPNPVDWSNFHQALTAIPYFSDLWHSVAISLISAVLSTISSAFVGFGFARLNGRGKKAMFTIVLSTMMLPGIVTLIPTYLIFSKIGLIDTYWPWVMWGIGGSAFLIFLFRQFFAGIPMELEEAAILDGCGYFRIFARIFLPQARSMLATGMILIFTWTWGDYITQNLLLSNDKMTLSMALAYGYTDASGNPMPSVQVAGAVLYVIPVLILVLIAQRSYMANFTTSGLK